MAFDRALRHPRENYQSDLATRGPCMAPRVMAYASNLASAKRVRFFDFPATRADGVPLLRIPPLASCDALANATLQVS